MNYLACCSENGTCHIFDMTPSDKNVTSTFNLLGSVVPNIIGGSYFESKWSFVTVDLATTSKMICKFDINDALHIVAYNGDYFRVRGSTFDDIKKSNLQTNN